MERPKLALVKNCGDDPTQPRAPSATRPHLAACNESSFSAASPLGSALLPFCKSQMEEGERPTESPISSRVMPRFRRSRMRDDHVFMPRIVRNPVLHCQRDSVTAVRDNKYMRKFKHYRECITLGDRIVFWREARGLKQAQLARLLRIPTSSLSEIENNGQRNSAKTPMIAAALEINAQYLASGEGDPLDVKAVPAPHDAVGELARMVLPEDLAKLTQTEFALAQFQVREVVNDILKARKPSRSQKAG